MYISLTNICLFVFCCSKIFSLIWRHHHYCCRAANFYLFSALMAIEQWRFFSVPHLLWHGASVYNGHIREPWHSPIAERLAVELSLLVFTTYVCRGWDSKTQPFACGANALTRCATAAMKQWKFCTSNIVTCTDQSHSSSVRRAYFLDKRTSLKIYLQSRSILDVLVGNGIGRGLLSTE